MAGMIFQRVPIEVVQAAEFAQLKDAIDRIFAPASVEKYLGKVRSKGIRIRNWQGVLDYALIEKVDVQGQWKHQSNNAKALYSALPESDQGLMREFYLEKLEHVDPPLRLKFSKVYQYY